MDRQLQMLRSIAAYQDEHGHPPSIRDLAARVGYASESSAWRVIDQLIAADLLTVCSKCPPATTRTIMLTIYGHALLKVSA